MIITKKYGIAIGNVIGFSKTKGFSFVSDYFFSNVQFYMIGDSDADIINDPNVLHLAVGNATDKLKEKFVFISNKNYTFGRYNL